MPAYDTPPPPPMHLLRTQQRRSGPVIVAMGGGFLIMLAGLFFVRQERVEREARPPRERSMVKAAKLAQAALLYAEDHERFPGGEHWDKQLAPYGIKPVDLMTPAGSWAKFSMRRGSQSQKKATLANPGTYTLFMDGVGGYGSAMWPVDLQTSWNSIPYRRKGKPGNVFSFADGHAAFIAQQDWDPENTETGPVR